MSGIAKLGLCRNHHNNDKVCQSVYVVGNASE